MTLARQPGDSLARGLTRVAQFGNVLCMFDTQPKLEVPEVLDITVGFDGLPSLLQDLDDLDIDGVKVTFVHTAGSERRYTVSLTKGEVFALINKHALNMVTSKYL